MFQEHARWRRHRIGLGLPHVGASVRGLRQEEQDLLHGLVLPPGCHCCRRALQHCPWVGHGTLWCPFCVVYGVASQNESAEKMNAHDLVGVLRPLQVLCVHSLLEHTDVTIMYDNEALYDICRRCFGCCLACAAHVICSRITV